VDEIRAREESIAELLGLANRLTVEKRFLFVETPENLEEIIAMSDCVVAPFMDERFSSVSLLEAMAMGKPIIATDLGEQREFIENGVNGYLVPPGDEEALALKILHVLGDREELQRLSQQARAKAEQYSRDNFVRTLESVYSQLASDSSK
jgi:glycosyltransferase involved in cell wall biosynthesis